MKILAIEKDLKEVDWSNQAEHLRQEAEQAYRLYLDGHIREIYFTENKNAVLILECENMEKAEELLHSLPLVKEKLIGFKTMQLRPYTGFERLMN